MSGELQVTNIVQANLPTDPRTAPALTRWIKATLLNSWVSFGGGFADPGFVVEGNWVELRGVAKSGTIPATMFVLPPNARPAVILTFPAASSSLGRVQINTDGSVIVELGSNQYVSLDGIRFRLS